MLFRSLVEYAIRNGGTMRGALPELYPTDATEAALKSDLVRSEWTLETTPTEIPGTAQLVGEYAVDFDATLTVDDATGVGQVVTRSLPFGDYVNIARYADDLIAAGTAVGRMPQRIRSAVLRLSIRDRGVLREGAFADIVIFDPTTIIDRATFEQPNQLSEGVRDVFVNGTAVVKGGKHTGARPGAIVRGPGWSGWR